MPSVSMRSLIAAMDRSLTILVATTLLATYSFAGSGTLTVSGTQWGVSTAYLGANEGSSQFNINDLVDLGINTYRLYGGMSRWEPTDDSSTYGSPSIAQIQADPNVINWAFWDNIMTNPPGGSDYSWSASTGIPPVNARTILGDLNAHNIKPIVVLRNVDNNHNPAWSQAHNPPTTTADWNEWWEHVFATVYWFNVRNSYVIDDWEVHNEPNVSGQGWGGTESQYDTFIQYTADAIHYVYSHYLPGRTPHIYAPVTSNCCTWANDAMKLVGPTVFDSLDFHDYQSNPNGEVETLRADMNADGYANAPVWITEMGSWHQNVYNSVSNGNSLIIAYWIRGSSPGNDHVNGVELFSLYDWGSGYTSGAVHGSYPAAESYQPGYYAMRIAARALTGARPTYQVTSSNSNLVSIATKDTGGAMYLIVCNNGSPAVTVTADLSALKTTGTGTQWEYSSTYLDAVIAYPSLTNGKVTFTVPANGTELLKF